MDIEAFILVGGRSSRFGRDKANVIIDGKTLLERTVDTVRDALGPTRITLVAANDRQLSGSLLRLSLPVVFDLYEDRGSVGAVHAALAYARTEWSFVIACDYPLISAELIERLEKSISSDVDAVAPVQPDGRVQPLVAFYRCASILKVVEEPLIDLRAAPPLASIFDHSRTVLVPFQQLNDLPNSDELFLNMNTPSDLIQAEEILRGLRQI